MADETEPVELESFNDELESVKDDLTVEQCNNQQEISEENQDKLSLSLSIELVKKILFIQ